MRFAYKLLRIVAFLGASSAGCGSFMSAASYADDDAAPAPSPDAATEAATDASAERLRCAPTDPWREVVTVEVQGTLAARAPRLSLDELELYAQARIPAPDGGTDEVETAIRARRTSRDVPFASVESIRDVVEVPDDTDLGSTLLDPATSADGLVLVVTQARAGLGHRVLRSRRARTRDPWPAAVPLPIENAARAFPHGATKTIWLDAPLGDAGAVVQVYSELEEVARPAPELGAPGVEAWLPSLSADGLTVIFSRRVPRNDGSGGIDFRLFQATRSRIDARFDAPQRLDVMPTAGDLDQGQFLAGWLSDDACRLYFSRERFGIASLFMARR